MMSRKEESLQFLSENVFAHHKIPKDMVFDHLNKIFTGTLYAIADKEEEFLNEYCEKSFANRLIKSV